MTVDMAGLQPEVRKAFRDFQAAAETAGLKLEPRSARRTCAEQAEQYAIGRGAGDTRAVVTHAQGCVSWHVSGRAIDVNVIGPSGKVSTNPSDYVAMGELAESLGWVWGGRFSGFGPGGDAGHIEWRYDPAGRKLTLADVCPNPSVCVDVPATTDPEESSIPWGMVALAGGALGLAAVVGVTLARKR